MYEIKKNSTNVFIKAPLRLHQLTQANSTQYIHFHKTFHIYAQNDIFPTDIFTVPELFLSVLTELHFA